MKLGFLTDSFPVEFLNQVDNKKKKRDLEERFMLVFDLFEIVMSIVASLQC